MHYAIEPERVFIFASFGYNDKRNAIINNEKKSSEPLKKS